MEHGFDDVVDEIVYTADYKETITKGMLTCFNCIDRDTCDCAWDIYNTNGDCLAAK